MVSVDLNGFKNPPNRFGYDVFTFQLVDENLKTMGDRNTMYTDMDKYCSLNSKDKYNGIACAQKARSESDYFKWVVKNMRQDSIFLALRVIFLQGNIQVEF